MSISIPRKFVRKVATIHLIPTLLSFRYPFPPCIRFVVCFYVNVCLACTDVRVRIVNLIKLILELDKRQVKQRAYLQSSLLIGLLPVDA